MQIYCHRIAQKLYIWVALQVTKDRILRTYEFFGKYWKWMETERSTQSTSLRMNFGYPWSTIMPKQILKVSRPVQICSKFWNCFINFVRYYLSKKFFCNSCQSPLKFKIFIYLKSWRSISKLLICSKQMIFMHIAHCFINFAWNCPSKHFSNSSKFPGNFNILFSIKSSKSI